MRDNFADMSGGFADMSGDFADTSGGFADMSETFADTSGDFADTSAKSFLRMVSHVKRKKRGRAMKAVTREKGVTGAGVPVDCIFRIG
ncbi:MAG: hypothetical protein LBK25_07565 [Treponema sp.]|jgi:hypothetical protein|nr:hypothetical protein [Treponema sp.]